MSATKRQRITTLDSVQAPVGFHYEGMPCCMFEGRATRRLRRDIEGTREEIYCDLYCKQDITEGVADLPRLGQKSLFCLRFVSAATRELARRHRFFPPSASSTSATIQTTLLTNKLNKSALTMTLRLGRHFLKSDLGSGIVYSI